MIFYLIPILALELKLNGVDQLSFGGLGVILFDVSSCTNFFSYVKHFFVKKILPFFRFKRVNKSEKCTKWAYLVQCHDEKRTFKSCGSINLLCQVIIEQIDTDCQVKY